MTWRRYKADIPLFDRREVLRFGAVGAGAALLLPGCDTLHLPEVAPVDRVPDLVPNDDFYVQSAFGTPAVDPDTHVLAIVDADGNELGTLDLATVEALDAREREHTLECIGATPRFLFIGNAAWEGLPFRELLAGLGVVVPDDATWMRITGADDYSTGLPIGDLDGSDGADPMWLVWRMNGEPLPRAHGAPFRFLVPGRYGTKNPKWPTEVAFVREEYVGHWEQRGWSQQAKYRTNGLILSPPSMAVVGAGAVRIVGSAFGGHTPITTIEVTTDGGATWVPAVVDYTPLDSGIPPDSTDVSADRHIWTTWSFDWTLQERGEYTIQVRVTDGTGYTTSLDSAGPGDRAGYDAGMEISVRVT